MAILGNKSIKEFIGLVISDKTDKTRTVQVTTTSTHPLYRKRVTQTKKYYVHDENNESAAGDRILIRETRPLSRTKRRKFIKIVEKSQENIQKEKSAETAPEKNSEPSEN